VWRVGSMIREAPTRPAPPRVRAMGAMSERFIGYSSASRAAKLSSRTMPTGGLEASNSVFCDCSVTRRPPRWPRTIPGRGRRRWHTGDRTSARRRHAASSGWLQRRHYVVLVSSAVGAGEEHTGELLDHIDALRVF